MPVPEKKTATRSLSLDGVYGISGGAGSLGGRIQFAGETLLDVGGQEFLFTDLCRELEVRPRLCGDYYSAIRGADFWVSDVGATPAEATAKALEKVPA